MDVQRWVLPLAPFPLAVWAAGRSLWVGVSPELVTCELLAGWGKSCAGHCCPCGAVGGKHSDLPLWLCPPPFSAPHTLSLCAVSLQTGVCLCSHSRPGMQGCWGRRVGLRVCSLPVMSFFALSQADKGPEGSRLRAPRCGGPPRAWPSPRGGLGRSPCPARLSGFSAHPCRGAVMCTAAVAQVPVQWQHVVPAPELGRARLLSDSVP